MRQLLRGVTTALLIAAASLTAHAESALEKATTFGTDFSGLWYNTAESGWGVNIVQQSNTMFVTLFVYGTDGRPTWYVGDNVSTTGQVDSQGVITFTGPFYATTGPFFGAGSFNSASVTAQQVGTFTFRASQYNAAQISYTVNGTPVVKNVVPQTWKANDLSGTYIGALAGANASCNLPVAQTANLLTFTITHSGTTATIVAVDASNNRCTMTGTVSQFGKQSQILGTYTCSNGASRSFGLGQIEAGFFGITGFYVDVTNSGCSASAASLGAARVR
jgi:hypothetical protein